MRIKKTSQYIQDGAILPSYFTDEIDTGMKWIDGKPIYRKVITPTLTTLNGWVYTVVSNMEVCVNIFGFCTPTNYSNNRRYLWQSSNDIVTQTNNGGRFALKTSDETLLTTWTIILEYTKTTD